MNKKELMGFIGLLNRGGNLVFGESVYFSYKVSLLLLASDCSANSRKKALSYASKYNLDVVEMLNKSELGSSLGYEELSVVGIINRKSSLALKKKLGLKGEQNEEKR